MHLVQRLLSLRKTRVPGRRRAERRISGVGFRWCAAPRLRTWCTNPRKTLFLRFPCTKSLSLFGASTPWTWCKDSRKTLFLRFLCTKSLVLFGVPALRTWCKDSRKTLVPSFPLHQVFGPFRSSNPSDLVHESPQNLVSSFPLHQVFGVQFSVYDVTWCFAPRNPLFLRPEAPRRQVRMSLCRHGRGAPSPAIPCSFVRKHHVPRSGWASADMDVVLHSPQSLIPSSRGATSPAPDGIGEGSADEFSIRLHFLPLLFCIDRKSSGAIAPLLFLHNPIKFYYFTFPLLFGAVYALYAIPDFPLLPRSAFTL